ncbi:MAG TPA: hypothetical protein VK814_06510 [Acidobacteriaceae bacterium]|jgi:hypothetical protein|nr:hypothetical protein [Acidobacteriaceae bacterium]
MISVTQNTAKNQVGDQPFDGGEGPKSYFSAGGDQAIPKIETHRGTPTGRQKEGLQNVGCMDKP